MVDDQELIRLYVGKNAEYYLHKWGKSINPESSFSWNWAAFLTCAFWIGYRQMYAYLAILAGVFLASDIFYLIILGKEPDFRITIILFLLMGSFGNALYYRHVNKKIQQLKELNLEPEELREVVARSGGVSWRGILAALLFLYTYGMIMGFLTSL